MFPSAEILLMAGIAGLYLYDSMLLLCCNEGILSPAGKKGWTIRFGSEHFQMLGKEPFLPNPFLLHRPIFRLSWNPETSATNARWTPPKREFSVLTPVLYGMAAALFVCLPLGLFTRLGDAAIVAALALFYGSTITALLLVWKNRAVLQCSSKRFAGLAFESLICPPFALNLIRHLSAGISVNEDLVHAARRLQQANDWNASRAKFLARLDDEIAWEDDKSERRGILLGHRRILTEEDAQCPAPKSS